MIYRTDGMVLSGIRKVFHGALNDVEVCEDTASPARTRYTLLSVMDRNCAKTLLKVFDSSQKRGPNGEPPYLKIFSSGETLCFLFEYRAERRLASFGAGQLTSAVLRELISVNLIMACLTSSLPYPLLYLALAPENIHLAMDNSIYLTPYFDLSQMDPSKMEAQCTDRCVEVLLDVLESGSGKKLKSFELLRKKAQKNAYRNFPELYRDVRLTAVPVQKNSFAARARGWWKRNKDRVFRILLVLCVVSAILALVIFVFQLFFKDVPFFRLFEHSFDKIGTERLNQ